MTGQAWALLEPRAGEAAPPAAVLATLAFFERHGLWHLLARNAKAMSCRDAANKRYRLGKMGIPVEDELKSFFGAHTGADGRRHHVAVHCRGDQLLDMAKLRAALGAVSDVERLVTTDSSDDSIYGLVNPFSLANGFEGAPVTQLFDQGVLEVRGLPNTMMTNAGDRTWSVEFRPRDVIEALGAQVADIVEAPPLPRHGPVGIGIVTGNAPDSGIILWQHINRRVQEIMAHRFQGDLSYPPVSVRSVPGLGLSMELDKRAEQVWEQLEPAVRSLCEEGARLLCLACHTNHYFTDRIRAVAAEYGSTFVSVAESVGEWARREQVPELTLVGISYVAGFGEWSAYRNLAAITRVEPLSDKGLERIHELGYQVKREGATDSGRAKLRAILNDEARTSHVVIALTELSILLDSQRKPGKSGRVIVDALKIYGEEVAATYIGLAKPREMA
ncbi:MAG: aspartate/glutamate racemase family protein [Alphaproteobacteria bacterium]|nr:aspartate/glutamate racemase family protein [Alphaproteobacteria bacterium]